MACRKRHCLLAVCVIQLIIVIWRQVFDYLGFMWGPIIINFLQIIFVIFGFFGAWQYRSKYMLSYTIWSIFWCGWNVFIISFYENVGVLNRELDILNLGTGSVTWWEANGPGCKALFLANGTTGGDTVETYPWRPPRPDIVTGCLLQYHHLESAQAALHFVLAVMGVSLGISILGTIRKKEENAASANNSKGGLPLYSVQYAPHRNGNDCTAESMDDEGEFSRGVNGGAGSRPMTPRRVKRRSVHSRGSAPPPPYQQATSSHHQPGQQLPLVHQQHGLMRRHHHGSRSSGRRRSHHRNPVTQLMDQAAVAVHHEKGGHTNMNYQQSSSHSLYEEERPSSARSSYSNYHGTRSHSYRHSHNFLATGPPAYSSQSETAI